MTDPSTHEYLARQFLKHQPLLMDYLQALVRNPHDAEDLCQELGVRILSRETAPPPPEEFPAWCRGIAKNLALHYWRAHRRRRVILDKRLLAAIDAAYEETDAANELWSLRRHALDECLRRLPASSRRMLRMRYAEGAHSVQIAATLHRSATAVRMALVRVRHALGECIQARLSEGGA